MKHESHTRSRNVSLPWMLTVSVASQQKQVGQTWVQLAHERQRFPISVQRSASRCAVRRSGRSLVSSERTIELAARSIACLAVFCINPDGRSYARGRRKLRPSSDPISMRKTSSNSVMHRSKPALTRGPVPREVQKQVLSGSRQFTARIKRPSRRRR